MPVKPGPVAQSAPGKLPGNLESASMEKLSAMRESAPKQGLKPVIKPLGVLAPVPTSPDRNTWAPAYAKQAAVKLDAVSQPLAYCPRRTEEKPAFKSLAAPNKPEVETTLVQPVAAAEKISRPLEAPVALAQPVASVEKNKAIEAPAAVALPLAQERFEKPTATQLYRIVQRTCGLNARQVQVVGQPDKSLVVRVLVASPQAEKTVTDMLLGLPELAASEVHLEIIVGQ
jgi:hypothetical protein